MAAMGTLGHERAGIAGKSGSAADLRAMVTSRPLGQPEACTTRPHRPLARAWTEIELARLLRCGH